MIRIGIMGYGNLGRGVEYAISQNPDTELAAVFTRRSVGDIMPRDKTTPVYEASEARRYADDIDVMILCGGSATDLPKQTREYVGTFNVVDSFDTHANISAHFNEVDKAARKSGKVGIISVGWDPGLFSLNRMYANAILPQGTDNTFWGRGVSQGHSDAVRRIDGVIDARQYTVPVPAAVEAVRAGQNPKLTTRDKHTRECYVVAEEGADKARITREIVTMKNYFDEYDTTVHFISAEEMACAHNTLPHGGFVIRSGETGAGTRQIIEYNLTLGSNPEFTGSVLLCFARAAVRLNRQGESGARTILDVPPAYLSALSGEELRRTML